MNKPPSRSSFIMAGVAGALASLLLTGFVAVLLPSLGDALLGEPRTGNRMIPLIFLLVLGFIAVAELPVMLYALVRIARRALPAPVLLSSHFFYTFFPAVYGTLGALLTGQGWWLWVMFFLSVMRLAPSVFAIHPGEMVERAQSLRSQDGRGMDEGRVAAVSRSRGAPSLAPIKGFILDMDGVLYRGNTVREGTIDFIEYLNGERIPYLCLTNNASYSREMSQAKLDRLRIPIDASNVLGTAQATTEWLQAHAASGARILAIGEPGLKDQLKNAGFQLVEEAPADWVVVGIDFSLSYDRLKRAALAIRQNARFIGTNPDTTFPSEEGLLPGNGAALAYLEAATGVQPMIIGKPSAAVMEIALAHLGLPAEDVAIVGDRLDTDILGGQNAGLQTILLHGGVTSTAEMKASPIRADHVFYDLGDLLQFYQKER